MGQMKIFTFGGAYSIDKYLRVPGECWWFGHLHRDEDLWKHQTVLWFELRNMANNERMD